MPMHDKTSALSYTSGGLLVTIGSMDWNTICMVGGLILGILTFAVNWYYKRENSRAYRTAIMKGVQLNEPKE
jgi:hypothetical protein